MEQTESKMKNADYAIADLIEKANPSPRSLLLAVNYARDYFNLGPDHMNVPGDEESQALGRDLVCHMQASSADDATQMSICMSTLDAAEEVALLNMI